MGDFKYQIGKKLYPAGCGKKYKLKNPFIVGKRKIETKTYEIEGETFRLDRHLYSPDANEFSAVWHGEGNLTKSTETGVY